MESNGENCIIVWKKKKRKGKKKRKKRKKNKKITTSIESRHQTTNKYR